MATENDIASIKADADPSLWPAANHKEKPEMAEETDKDLPTAGTRPAGERPQRGKVGPRVTTTYHHMGYFRQCVVCRQAVEIGPVPPTYGLTVEITNDGTTWITPHSLQCKKLAT